MLPPGFLYSRLERASCFRGQRRPLRKAFLRLPRGTAPWSAALMLTSVPKEFASWVRLIGIIGAILFAITAARSFWGEQVLPTSSPLPFFAYPFLVLTFVGWIWTLLKAD
jgi:hypothetical protein